MKHRLLSFGLVAALSLAVLPGCSDDDSDPSGGAGEGGDTSGGTAGTAGEGGDSNGGTSGGTTGGTGGLAGGTAGAGGDAGGGTTAGQGGAGGDDSGEGGAGGDDGQNTLTDPEIAEITIVLNLGEVEQAQAALLKLQSEPVIAFAQHMEMVHSDAAEDTETLATENGITPLESSWSVELQEISDDIVAQLGAASEAEADELYLQTQIDVHSDALLLLDEELIPHADDPELQAFLEQLRVQVAAHLESAEGLAAGLE